MNENELKDENLIVDEKVETSTEVKAEVETVESTKPVKVEKPKKEKKKTDEKPNWFLKVLKEEHKWETYLLGALSCLAIGIGALILTGQLVVNDNIPVLSDYYEVVGWIFEIVGILGFLLFIIPIFKPTRKEIKHLTYPTKNLFLGNVVRVFLFITILAGIFVLYESVISAVYGFIIGKM